jgi:hypothetical protein
MVGAIYGTRTTYAYLHSETVVDNAFVGVFAAAGDYYYCCWEK